MLIMLSFLKARFLSIKNLTLQLNNFKYWPKFEVPSN